MMIGSWLCEIKGLRFALLLAAGANLLGGWIRCIAYFVEGNGAYWIVVAGTVGYFVSNFKKLNRIVNGNYYIE